MARPAEIGQRIGPYAVGGYLGSGGMGRVFAVRDTRTGETRALKLLHPHLAEQPDARGRFERETRVAAAIRSAHIVRTFDSGGEDGQPYLVMEFVDGPSLARLIETAAPLAISDAALIGRQIAQALADAEREGVVHRDLKPSNVLLMRDGTVRVADFGIASHETDNTLSVESAFLGSLAYAPPEIAVGNVDARGDLYSLGCVLFELLTGEPAFLGPTPMAQFQRRLTEDPPDLAASRPDVPPDLAALVRSLLNREPDRRPQHADDIIDALGAFVDGPRLSDALLETTAQLQPVAALSMPSRPPRSNRRTVAAAGFALLAAGLTAVLLVAFTGGGESEPDPVAATVAPDDPDTERERDQAQPPQGATAEDETTDVPTAVDGADESPESDAATAPAEPESETAATQPDLAALDDVEAPGWTPALPLPPTQRGVLISAPSHLLLVGHAPNTRVVSVSTVPHDGEVPAGEWSPQSSVTQTDRDFVGAALAGDWLYVLPATSRCDIPQFIERAPYDNSTGEVGPFEVVGGPTALSRHGATMTIVNSRIYLVGGAQCLDAPDADRRSSEFASIDPVSGELSPWTLTASGTAAMADQRSEAAIASDGQFLYISPMASTVCSSAPPDRPRSTAPRSRRRCSTTCRRATSAGPPAASPPPRSRWSMRASGSRHRSTAPRSRRRCSTTCRPATSPGALAGSPPPRSRWSMRASASRPRSIPLPSRRTCSMTSRPATSAGALAGSPPPRS